MARKETRSSRRPADTPERKGKGGGMLSGMAIGLILGLVMAAGLAWYFNLGSSGIKPVESAPLAEGPKDTPPPEKPAKPAPPTPALESAEAPAPTEATASTHPASEAPQTTKPRVDYTFYGILPGEKPAKPLDPPKGKEIWWLQVAALKNPADADKLRARLTLLNLHVSTQKVDSAGQSLYRVRVGPYKREDDAFGDLDVLAQNNFEPRLLKEPVTP